jgi:PAS domain S-box-containing protein
MALIFRIGPAVSLWFPPSGVAIALTLWFGPIGVVLTGVTSILMSPMWGNNGWTSLVGLTDATEPLVAWWLYRHYFSGSLSFSRLRDAAAFTLSMPFASCATSAVVGSFALVVVGNMPLSNLAISIPNWWLGNALGTLAIAPTALLVLTPFLQSRGWLSYPNQQSQIESVPCPPYRSLVAEVVTIQVFVVATAALTVSQTNSAGFAFQQFSFLSFVPIIWAATRFGVTGGMLTSSFCVLVTLLAYLFAYPNAISLPTFPVQAEVLHVHKLSLLVQCAVSLFVGCATTERAVTQVSLAVEGLRNMESEARAQLNELLIQLNDELKKANARLEQSNRDKEELLLRELIARAESEAARRAAESAREQVSQILESITDGFMAFDFEWRFTYLNREGAKILGRLPEELLGKNLWEEFPELSSSSFGQLYQRAVASGVPQELEDYYPPFDAWFAVRAYPLQEGLSLYCRNITVRKRAQQALLRAEERLRVAIKNSPISVFNHDRELRYTWIYNPSFAHQRDTVVGKHDEDLISRDDAEVLTRIKRRVLETGIGTREEVKTTIQGRDWYYDLTVEPLRDVAGEVVGVTCAAVDITERKQAEEERNQLLVREQAARAEAEAANRIKDEFLAVLSHELRTPLNPILGWSKLLRTRKLDEATTARALETIERNAQLQTQLIEDLLDVSRILRGKLSLNVCAVDLATTIEAAIETVQLSAQAKSIQIQTMFDPTVGQVAGDPNRLQQVVWNLLSNAIKFTPSGERVEVRLSVVEGLKIGRLEGWKVGKLEGNLQATNLQPANLQPANLQLANLQPATSYAQIQVSDTGAGINPDFLPFVFDYFRQENSSTTRVFGGLGLGLAIVRHLVELHGGSVKATSPGVRLGATFTVILPLMNLEPQRREDKGRLDDAPNLQELRVLVVDDEVDTLKLLVFILEQYGAQVRAVSSGREALEVMAQWQPDLLLSDIGMPEVDGYMLIHQIRSLPLEQGGQIRAIALTAYAGETDQQQILEAGFHRHVTKPVDPVELATVIADLVGT